MIRRLAFFLYGVASYLVFLATFLYAIAFVGGFIVPTRLDGPLASPLREALAIDVALLTVFAIQHSVMARRWFKRRWTRFVPPAIERSTYVLCASVALLLLFWQWRPLGVGIWSVDNPAARAVLWALFAAGWGTVLAVTFLINHFDLFGLRQAWLYVTGRDYRHLPFRTVALYRYIRHPIMTGAFIGIWFTPVMTVGHLLFTTGMSVYILIGVYHEEKNLVAAFGEKYRHYRRTTGRFLPALFTRRTASGRSMQSGA